MKTTIDIPEPLYKQAKIHAVETGQTLKQLVLTALTRELEIPSPGTEKPKSFWERRRLLPEYAEAMRAGAYRPLPDERDVTMLISDDRDGH
jgi:hypothetical protein